MKNQKNNKILVFILTATLMFSSCNKDDGKITTAEFDNSNYLKTLSDYSGIELTSKEQAGPNGSKSILTFENKEHFTKVLRELDQNFNEMDEAFVSFYKDLNVEQLIDKELTVGHNSEIVYDNISKLFGFNSLFTDVVLKKEQSMQQPDFEFNDGAHYISIDNALMSVLNLDYEVKIGDEIRTYNEFGEYLEEDIDECTGINYIQYTKTVSQETGVEYLIEVGSYYTKERGTIFSNKGYIKVNDKWRNVHLYLATKVLEGAVTCEGTKVNPLVTKKITSNMVSHLTFQDGIMHDNIISII